ncbi:hypothetical protein RIF29_04389 [Crotalaria pallida]|uniref:Reverse transcriptase zinc-binding domain-containing protein n=1 Tax=Crotalaria pallida TaxID=3830 RepID=A0AAN9PA06_CROPI
MKIFFWRVIKNILPTKDNLLRKKVPLSPICSGCHEEFESVQHALFQCDFAKRVWELLDLKQIRDGGVRRNPKEWFEDMIQSKSKENVRFSVVVLWCLWNARNSRDFQSKYKTAEEVSYEVGSELEPPPAAVYLSSNGAFSVDEGKGGSGYVICSAGGQFLAGGGESNAFPPSPQYQEALAGQV